MVGSKLVTGGFDSEVIGSGSLGGFRAERLKGEVRRTGQDGVEIGVYIVAHGGVTFPGIV